MRKPGKLAAVLALFIVVSVAGTLLAVRSIERHLTNGSQGEKKAIAIMTYSLSDSMFYREFVDVATEYAAYQGYSVQALDGQGNSAVQINQIESLILSKVDAIIIDPCDPVSLSPVIKRAMDAGIKTVVIGKETEYYDCYCNVDHYECGYMLAEYACGWINEHLDGKATIAILNGRTLDNLNQRESGMTDAIGTLSPNSTIIAAVQGIDQTEGMDALQTLMVAHPNIDVVLCVNDDGALGASKLLSSLSVDPDRFFIGSVDGTEAALDLLETNPLFKATVTVDVEKSAMFSIQAAIDLAAGKAGTSFPLSCILVSSSPSYEHDLANDGEGTK